MAMVSPENDYIVRLMNSLSGENSYAIEYCRRMCVFYVMKDQWHQESSIKGQRS